MNEDKLLKVGSAKEKLSFPKDFFPIENFSHIHDDLHVRVLYLEANQPFILLSFELTSLREYVIEELKKVICKQTHIPYQNIWICVTHTFSAPHSRSVTALKKGSHAMKQKNKVFCDIVYQSAKVAVVKAIQQKQMAYVGFGHGFCSVNVNRDVPTKDGWWLGANDLGISDKTVPIIKFENKQHHTIALLYSYDVQSSIMEGSLQEDEKYAVTSDLTGMASQYIESQYDNCVAMYIVGAAGDQAPLFQAKHHIIDKQGQMHITDIHEDGFIFVKALGTKLGTQVVSACERIKTASYLGAIQNIQTQFICPGQKIRDRNELIPTHYYNYMEDQNQTVGVEIIQFGYIVIIGVQPELSSVSAMDIRKQSPFPITMILTMVNGGAKYMPDQISYDRITYEAMNSKFAKGSAEILAEQIVKTLENIKM